MLAESVDTQKVTNHIVMTVRTSHWIFHCHQELQWVLYWTPPVYVALTVITMAAVAIGSAHTGETTQHLLVALDYCPEASDAVKWAAPRYLFSTHTCATIWATWKCRGDITPRETFNPWGIGAITFLPWVGRGWGWWFLYVL